MYRFHMYSLKFGNQQTWLVEPTTSDRWKPPSVRDFTLYGRNPVGRWFIPLQCSVSYLPIVTSCQVQDFFFPYDLIIVIRAKAHEEGFVNHQQTSTKKPSGYSNGFNRLNSVPR